MTNMASRAWRLTRRVWIPMLPALVASPVVEVGVSSSILVAVVVVVVGSVLPIFVLPSVLFAVYIICFPVANYYYYHFSK